MIEVSFGECQNGVHVIERMKKVGAQKKCVKVFKIVVRESDRVKGG